jgi:hypothetical protein
LFFRGKITLIESFSNVDHLRKVPLLLENEDRYVPEETATVTSSRVGHAHLSCLTTAFVLNPLRALPVIIAKAGGICFCGLNEPDLTCQ